MKRTKKSAKKSQKQSRGLLMGVQSLYDRRSHWIGSAVHHGLALQDFSQPVSSVALAAARSLLQPDCSVYQTPECGQQPCMSPIHPPCFRVAACQSPGTDRYPKGVFCCATFISAWMSTLRPRGHVPSKGCQAPSFAPDCRGSRSAWPDIAVGAPPPSSRVHRYLFACAHSAALGIFIQ